ncbi:MAG TPA: NAD(P)H-dependent glycerol-3-phosphate dehydrogenase [Vicinamibacterales bacterium]|nr:NAD(P)H-dependent glycerol-3-phosphate dehydrogenase [Vicinamibacterales bacterium]
MMQDIGVLGAGSWGTALAVHLARTGHHVRLWAREAEVVDQMRVHRENRIFLPGIPLPPAIEPCDDFRAALPGTGVVLVAVPSHGIRAVLHAAAPSLPPSAVIVSATKGLEPGTLLRASQVAAEVVGPDRPVVVLSGPSFALEVARELPTVVCAASSDRAAAERVQAEFRGRFFRIYTTPDVIGVEIGAALKNVIAIAAGVVEGLGLGHNAMAGLITRGLAEIARLAGALGARRETLAGLAGLGDLVLTCTGSLSRNRQVGVELGRGRSLDEILGGMKMVAEGVQTTASALALGARVGVELPIAAQMADVLSGRQTPRAAVEELMLRPQKGELEGRW